MREKKFIAWVPCVSGNLYFRHVKCGLSKKINCEVNNIQLRKRGDNKYLRQIVISSCYDWRDTKKKGDGTVNYGKFSIAMLGSVEEDVAEQSGSKLKGSIFIYSQKRAKSNSNWTSILKDMKLLEKFVRKKKRSQLLYNRLERKLNILEDKLYFQVDYEVDRKGFAYLDYIKRSDKPESMVHVHTIVRQAFYYLKYSIHSHVHHDAKIDSLTSVHNFNENSARHLIDDLKEHFVNLKRYVVRARAKKFYKAQGIAAYAKSLITSCRAQKLITKKEQINEEKYIDNILASFETLKNGKKDKTAFNIWVIGFFSGFIILSYNLIRFLKLDVLFENEKLKLFAESILSYDLSYIPNFFIKLYSWFFSSQSKIEYIHSIELSSVLAWIFLSVPIVYVYAFFRILVDYSFINPVNLKFSAVIKRYFYYRMWFIESLAINGSRALVLVTYTWLWWELIKFIRLM